VLGGIAARLQLAFPHPGELAARIGGEEFGVVLEGLDGAAAAARAEGFRRALAAQPLLVDGLEHRVTISIGWAEFEPARYPDLDGFYRAADRALYRAKREGRNRVCEDAQADEAMTRTPLPPKACRIPPRTALGSKGEADEGPS
jgi:diguanylate cyclase (GGDEF)-like protein